MFKIFLQKKNDKVGGWEIWEGGSKSCVVVCPENKVICFFFGGQLDDAPRKTHTHQPEKSKEII